MNYPTISVIIPTFNSASTITSCLSSIRKQDYPQRKIEIILIDGGSTDDTKKLSKKFKVKWITVDPEKQNVEYNKSIGIQHATGEILFMVDHDNVLPNKNIINKMIKPFIENDEVVGVETYRYHYNKKHTVLDRYFALFGVNDPLPWYLGKADRMPHLFEGYAKKYNPINKGTYYLVKFTPGNIPTIGANGFMVRKDILLKYANTKSKSYFPIDVNVDLIRKGYNTYAFIKDSITHLSGRGSVMNYLKRRMLFMRQYYLSDNNIHLMSQRRYSVYENKDFWKLVYFIIISLTVVIPLFDSIRGYIKVRDNAWFLHPIICFAFVVIYGYVIIEHQIKLLLKAKK